MRNLFGRISRFLFGRLPPLMNWEILIGKTVVGKITSESVYWNSGYGYYHFSPAAGFAEISGLINQVQLAIESGDDAAEDNAYEQMRGIPFMLRSPQGKSLEKESFDLYIVQEDEVRIRLFEPAWETIKDADGSKRCAMG